MPIFGAVGAWLMKLILGGGLAGVGKIAVDLYSKKLDAEGSTQNVVADITKREIALSEKETEVNGRLLIAEQGNWATRWVRPVWSIPYIFLTYKVVIWDWCLGLGTTYEPKGFFATLGVTIAASYFGGRSVETVARIIADTRRGVTGR